MLACTTNAIENEPILSTQNGNRRQCGTSNKLHACIVRTEARFLPFVGAAVRLYICVFSAMAWKVAWNNTRALRRIV